MYVLAPLVCTAQEEYMADDDSPNTDLYRLVYVSVASPGLTDADILTILNTSQSNNDERFLTGFLAHNGEGFMQILEGPQEEVELIYSRILKDTRHSSVQQIIGESIAQRAFPNWSMNYHRVDGPPGSSMMIARNEDAVDGLMDGVTDREVLVLFSRFLRMKRIRIH